MLFLLIGGPLLFGGLGYAIGRASDRRWAIWIVPSFVGVIAVLWFPRSAGLFLLFLWIAGNGMLGTYLGRRGRAQIPAS